MDWLLSKILEKVKSVVSQEAESGIRLVVGVKEDVDKLSSTFRTIQAVLEDAERRQVKEKAVRIWLDELRSIAYDMEDVLDEWNTAILKSQIQLDASSSTFSSKVRSLIQSPRMSIARLVQRRDIADKIKGLNERLEAISKEKDDFAFLVDLTRKNNDLESERSKTTYFVDTYEIHGRDEDKDTLISLLLSERNHRERGIPIISIVGMGGIGKTTLAQVVYNHDEVTAYFQEKIWVCVSDPFDEMRIAKVILEALNVSVSGLNELNSVLEKIHESIVGKEYLLVLDDVWNEDVRKWQSLKCCLQSGSQGSKILVTTRKEDVATVMGCTELFHLEKLSQEECSSLFSQIAFSGRNDRERESLEDIGKKIADKCQGLPLAVKTLGGLVRFKKSREQWQRILDSPMWQLDKVEEGLFSPLLLSYYDLPSPLRQCFSYCAIFPKDHEIEKDLLIKYWMAQGFLGEGSDMEIVGEEYFDNLAARSFFQEFEKDANDDSRIIRCKMHDIVHDFAQLLRKNECCIVLASSEERGADRYHGNVRHLRLIGGIPDLIYNVKRLRSLLIDGYSLFIDGYRLESWPESFNQLTFLRKLDLWESSIRVLPPEIGKLIHLRYFSIRGNSQLVELPEALCDLCNLQTLNIRRCYQLQKLPVGMEKLINIRHLQNEGTDAFIPKGMQRLTCLQTLEWLKLEKKGGNESETSFRLADLGNLIHLRGRLTIERLGNVGEAEVSEAREARLSTKAGLHELSLYFDGGDDKEPQRRIEDEATVLQAFEPPQHLRELKIGICKGPVFPFPNWMMSLTSLKSVTLWWCDNWERLPPMGKLPYLESLCICNMCKVKIVGEEFLGLETSTSSSSVNHNNIIAFPSLKTLEFEHMKRWEEWEYDEKVLRSEGGDDSSSSSSNITTITVMPKLQRLYIWNCPQLKTLPRHLLQSRALQELEISDCPILHRRFNKETGEDWPYVSHIPKIEIWEADNEDDEDLDCETTDDKDSDSDAAYDEDLDSEFADDEDSDSDAADDEDSDSEVADMIK